VLEFPFAAAYLSAIGLDPLDQKPSVEPAVETSGKSSAQVLEVLRRNSAMTLVDVAAEVGRSLRTVEVASAKLTGPTRQVAPGRPPQRWP